MKACLPVTTESILLSSDATKSEIATEKNKLVTTLKTAIRECINTIKPSSIDLSPPFPEAVPQEGNARFRKAEQPLGVQWEPHAWLGGNEQDIFMHPGAAIWLRLIPSLRCFLNVPNPESFKTPSVSSVAIISSMTASTSTDAVVRGTLVVS